MDIYLAGTPVALTVPLQDRSGNALDVAQIEYRVIDQAGSQKVARTELADFVPGSAEAVVVVPAEVNAVAPIPATITVDQIDQFNVREARTVELFVTDSSGNVTVLAKSYALEPADVLIVGLNSFQTLPGADLVALEIPNVPGWSAAAAHDKIAALIEARVRICQLRFVGVRQDSQNYLAEQGDIGELALLTPTQFASLSPRFKAALSKAQVAEADAILGGDPVDQRRQEGLILESIGEVKQMFRGGKPLDLPVSKRALKYLSPFVSFSKRIGRG